MAEDLVLRVFTVLLWGSAAFGWLITCQRAWNTIGEGISGLLLSMMPLLVLLAWSAGSHFAFAYRAYLILLAIAILTSLSAAVWFAKLQEDRLEQKQGVSSMRIFAARTALMAYGVICTAIVGAMIKATAYHLDYADYDLSIRLISLMEDTHRGELDSTATQRDSCREFLIATSYVSPEGIRLSKSRKSSFPFDSNWSVEWDSSKRIDYDLEFKEVTSGDFIVPTMTFTRREGTEECNLILSQSTVRDHQISSEELAGHLTTRVGELEKTLAYIESKPNSVQAFAAGAFLELLRVRGYSITPMNNKARLTDDLVHWALILASLVLLYVISFKPKKQLEPD